jgi:hypothetical protein
MAIYSAEFGLDASNVLHGAFDFEAADDKAAIEQAKQFVKDRFRNLTWISVTLKEIEAGYIVRMRSAPRSASIRINAS